MATERKRLLQRIRVPLGFAFGILYLYFAHLEMRTAAIGVALSLMGVWIRGWAAGHIRKNQRLAVSGPYAYTRNPLYLGSFIMGLGLSVGGGYWWFPVLFVILFLGIYLPVMRVEAGDLTDLFGEDFAEYARNVPLFIPRPTPWIRSEEGFDRGLYMKYREYRALLGVIAVWGVLGAKALFLH
jgi:hypothetical protein